MGEPYVRGPRVDGFPSPWAAASRLAHAFLSSLEMVQAGAGGERMLGQHLKLLLPPHSGSPQNNLVFERSLKGFRMGFFGGMGFRKCQVVIDGGGF